MVRPFNAACLVGSVRRFVRSQLLNSICVGFADILYIVLNCCELEGSVGKVGRSADLHAGFVIKSERIIPGTQGFGSAVYLQFLHTVNHDLNGIYGINVMEGNLLGYGVLKVVFRRQLAIPVIGNLYDQIVNGRIVGHAAARTLNLNNVVFVLSDLREGQLLRKGHVSESVIGSGYDRVAKIGQHTVGIKRRLTVFEDRKGKFVGNQIPAVQILANRRRYVQIDLCLFRLIGVGKTDGCRISADVQIGLTICSHFHNIKVSCNFLSGHILCKNDSYKIPSVIINPAFELIILFLNDEVIGNYVIAVGIVVDKVGIVVVADEKGFALGVGNGFADLGANRPNAVVLRCFVGFNNEACGSFSGVCLVVNFFLNGNRGSRLVIIVGKDWVYRILITITIVNDVHVVSDNRCLQIAVIINDRFRGKGVNRTVVGDVGIITLNLNNLIGTYAGLIKFQSQRSKCKGFTCIFALNNSYGFTFYIDPLIVFIFL